VGNSTYANHGRRVVEGQRYMQSASDIFLGWERFENPDGDDRDFYVRQMWDGKFSAQIELMEPGLLGVYGEMCGSTLARAHARSGDRIAIADYLGSSDTFDRAIAGFSAAYADQNQRDFEAVIAAVKSGVLEAHEDLPG
jgi:predicted alpha/beta hydrolase